MIGSRVSLSALAGALVLWALAGCTTPQTDQLLQHPRGLPPRAAVDAVPFFPQEQYYCGPAALAMVLAWSGLEVTPQDLVSQVYTPGREGTLRSDVVAGARRHGRLAVRVASLSDLLTELASGHPVLVFQNLALDWYPQWHFAVAVGYDLEAGVIVLHSGLDARRTMTLGTFEQTWRRGDHWALVVVPPDTLPATADEAAVLRAAAGLEQARQFKAAAVAYAGIAARWPGNLAALMGLGNVRYAEKEFTAAEAAYREAIARHPSAAAPWNNLAYALDAQGRGAEAVAAARQAVRLADHDEDHYRDTLREISDRSI